MSVIDDIKNTVNSRAKKYSKKWLENNPSKAIGKVLADVVKSKEWKENNPSKLLGKGIVNVAKTALGNKNFRSGAAEAMFAPTTVAYKTGDLARKLKNKSMNKK